MPPVSVNYYQPGTVRLASAAEGDFMLGNTENSRAGTAKHITGKRNDSLAGKQAKREMRLQTDGMTRRAAERQRRCRTPKSPSLSETRCVSGR